LSKEVQRKSSIETSTPEALVARGRSTERGEIRVEHPGLSQQAERVREDVGTVTKLGILKRIVGSCRSPRKTPKWRQIQLNHVQV
jgi:hypothetical protein